MIETTYPRTIQRRDGTQEIDSKMTTRAHKVSRLIVSLINPEDKDLRLYRIDIATLKSYLGYKKDFPNGRFYQDLKDIAHRVNKQPIEIRPEPKRILTAYFISSFEINYKTLYVQMGFDIVKNEIKYENPIRSHKTRCEQFVSSDAQSASE